MNAHEVALGCRGLRRSFGGIEVLHGVDLDIRGGEIAALMGENGAGKSTLISILSGVIPPDGGTITLPSGDVTRLTPHDALDRGIVAIQQEPTLVGDLAVWENLLLGRELRSGPLVRKVDGIALAREWLRAVGCHLDPRRPVRSLAPADRQLVEIARARGLGGRIFFFDEPTAVLGPTESRRLFDLIDELANGGAAVVYVSHRLEEVLAISERVVVLRDGSLVAEGRTDTYDARTLAKAMAGREVDAPPLPSSVRSTQKVLEVRGVCQGRLADVDLDVFAGEIHGVAGIVGSSRTRLAHVVAGSLRPRSGSISIDGRALKAGVRQAQAAGIAMVAEDRWRDALFGEMSQSSNICALDPPSRLGTITAAREGRAADPWVTSLAIRPRRPRLAARKLSGGNQQKIVLARALKMRPRLLVLDEPTRGVDVAAKHDIHGAVRDIAADGSGVLVVSSDLVELTSLCHRISVMADGRLVATFEPPFNPTDIMAAATSGSRSAS